MKTLKEVFDHHFSRVKFNDKLAKEIYRYQVGYVNANHEHMEFFGSGLLGVHVVRFKDSDVLKFYSDVLDVDYTELTRDIRRLETIRHDYKVAGDVLNLTLMYLIHGFMVSQEIKPDKGARAQYDVACIFYYRCLAALISAYFRYQLDPKIAQVAYGQLSDKYLIKKLGSWAKVVDYRTSDVVGKDALHYKTLLEFTDDIEVTKAVADIQGRIRDIIKNYYGVIKRVHGNGESLAVISGTVTNAEGEETNREKTSGAQNYSQYVLDALADENTFIKDELVEVIVKMNVNTSFRMVKTMLQWMTSHYSDGKYHEDIRDFSQAVMVQTMYFIEHNMEVRHQRDYSYILSQLKNLYLSTRTEDKEVQQIRELGYKLVKACNKSSSEGLALATRTSLILYISLRGLVGRMSVS